MIAHHLGTTVPLAITYAIVSWLGIGTLWDCASIVYVAIDTGRPFVYADRYSDALFGGVVVAARALTGRVRVLEASFAFAHLAVTLVAWGLLLHLLRNQSALAKLIAAVMVLVVLLPGQAYVCTAGNHIAVTMPVLIVLAATPMTGHRLALFAGVLLFCLLDHPGALIAIALAAAAMGLRRWLCSPRPSGAERIAVALTAVALAVSAWRLFLNTTAYERAEMELGTTLLHAELGLLGLPAVVVAMAYVAVLAFALWQLSGDRASGDVWCALGLVALLIAAACSLAWASEPARWVHGDTYRKFAILLNVPAGLLLAGAVIAPARAGGLGERPDSARVVAVAFGIIVFAHAGCLLTQSSQYRQLRDRLRDELLHANSGLVFLGPEHWAYRTPLRIWALPFNSILVQGRRPASIATFARPEDTAIDRPNGRIDFRPLPTVNLASGGWFRFEALREMPP